MTRLRSIIYIILVGCLAAITNSCADDTLDFYSGEYGDGVANVSMQVSFTGFEEKTLTRSGTVAPAAEGFNTMSDLVVLAYDSEGNLLDGNNGIQEITFNQSDLKDIPREDINSSEGEEGVKAESHTLSLQNISLRLPFGEYYLVAVSNLGSYSKDATGNINVLTSTYDILTTLYRDRINTLDDLRRLQVDWDKTNFINNREMLGYFTDMNATSPNSNSSFPKVRINRPGIELRAWLRRCVSKITIDFDGSGLRDDVEIYIKSARVYDYAKSCTLGFGKLDTFDETVTDFNNHPQEDGIVIGHTAHVIDYTDGKAVAEDNSDFASWGTLITVTNPYLTTMENGRNVKKNFHTESSPALYFYENMQGEAPNSKIPVPDLTDGGVSNADVLKDGVPYGTYVEVEAYYHSNHVDNMSDGPIKYRFMIGKDVLKNCDAERNYHFKLTLKFRGNANDYDWHIDYDRSAGFDVPNPWYVSYIYNHDAYLPFKYTPTEGYELADLTAEIVENPWYSSPSTTQAQLTDPLFEFGARTPVNEDLNAAYKSDYNGVVAKFKATTPYGENTKKYTGNGFLSLRAPRHDGIVTDIMSEKSWSGGFYDTKTNSDINQAYFDGKTKDHINHGFRTIMTAGEVDLFGDTEPRTYVDDREQTRNREKVEYRVEDGIYTFEIPLFTREKVLVKQTGYTGTNPFIGYQRIAKIRLTAKEKRKDNPSVTNTVRQYVNCVQVQRVLNPKGVYRKAGNSAPFHVVMMSLDSDGADAVFSPIISHGSWIADILGDGNFITLDGKQTVSGTTGSPIDFTIRFNRLSVGNKNAVVRVRYHNYTCTHLIFVRQGYDPQTISHDGKNLNGTSETPTVWHTFNMIARNVMATDPRDEGSMFKFGHSADAIDVSDNIYKDNSGNLLYHHLSVDEFDKYLNTALGPYTVLDADGHKKATKLAWNANTFTKDANGFTSGKMAKAATMRDFEQLYLTPNIQFGYGVLYADGASETQTTLANAYGWWRDDPDANANEKGMRGVFAYYYNGDVNSGQGSYNGRNIFFPIGRAGYGHRKNEKEETDNNYKGVLRYASQRCKPAADYGGVYMNFQHVSPLFEYLFRRSGAVYWAKNRQASYMEWNGVKTTASKESEYAYGCDFNFFTFDVNVITGPNVSHGEDACFVRTVE